MHDIKNSTYQIPNTNWKLDSTTVLGADRDKISQIWAVLDFESINTIRIYYTLENLYPVPENDFLVDSI